MTTIHNRWLGLPAEFNYLLKNNPRQNNFVENLENYFQVR